MPDLTDCLEQLGLTTVKTYLQTGNITCEHQGDLHILKSAIENSLTDRFNYQAFVLIFTQAELQAIVNNYPWPETPPDTHRYAILCSDSQIQSELLEFARANIQTEEKVDQGKNVIYWQVPRGITLTSPFGKHLGKPKYKATTTNRNLNTLEKML